MYALISSQYTDEVLKVVGHSALGSMSPATLTYCGPLYSPEVCVEPTSLIIQAAHEIAFHCYRDNPAAKRPAKITLAVSARRSMSLPMFTYCGLLYSPEVCVEPTSLIIQAAHEIAFHCYRDDPVAKRPAKITLAVSARRSMSLPMFTYCGPLYSPEVCVEPTSLIIQAAHEIAFHCYRDDPAAKRPAKITLAVSARRSMSLPMFTYCGPLYSPEVCVEPTSLIIQAAHEIPMLSRRPGCQTTGKDNSGCFCTQIYVAAHVHVLRPIVFA
ncbi:hypothetical protein J6590_023045 [Homalodisca vitripennis]|nr:hypothetical protein J6590_023045 [Homalodisca vitripennis]